MAMNHPTPRARNRDHPLPCGRSVEDVWNDVEARRTSSHDATCEHCATARGSLHQLAEATRALLADPAEPPPGLLDRIMAAVRADLRRTETLPLPSDLGPADISEPAVAAVLRYATDSVAGVRARSCRIEWADVPDAVRIRMTLSLRYGTAPGTAVFSAVRERITTAMTGQVGLSPAVIDLEVVDVWDGSPDDR